MATNTYANNYLINIYLSDLRVGCKEAHVDHTWALVLQFYFPVERFYSVERESYKEPASAKRIDISLVAIRSGTAQKLLFMECKRPAKDDQPADRQWTLATKKLRDYMVDSPSRIPNRTIYGIVGIGKQVRFFQLVPGASELAPYQGAQQIATGNQDTFSLSQTSTIHGIFQRLRQDIPAVAI